MQTTSLTLTRSLVDVHGIHPRDETMDIPIHSFADDHDTWPHHIDANASTLVSTPFLFHFFIFYLLSLPQLYPMTITMTTAPSLALPDDEDTITPIRLHTRHTPIREPICTSPSACMPPRVRAR